MIRYYYLVQNLETMETTILFKQDFNINYKWHREGEKKFIKNLLQDFKNKKAKVIQVYP